MSSLVTGHRRQSYFLRTHLGILPFLGGLLSAHGFAHAASATPTNWRLPCIQRTMGGSRTCRTRCEKHGSGAGSVIPSLRETTRNKARPTCWIFIYLMKYSIILHWERDRLLVLSVYGGGCHGSPIPEAPLNFKVPRTRVVQGPPRIVVALSIRNLDRSGTAWLVWDVSPIGKAKRMSIGGTAAQYCVG